MTVIAASASPAGPVHRLRGHALMLLATVLIATSFPVGAAITDGLDSVVLTLLRFALATVLFAPYVAWRHGLALPAPADLARYGLLSALLVSFFWCMFAALRLTSPLNTAAIFALTPVLTAAVAALLLRERLSLPARVALPFGTVGAVWIVFRGDLDALMALRLGAGDALFLAGTAALATYGALIKRLHRGEPMARMTFWTLATGTVWLAVLALPQFGAVDWAAVAPQVYAGIAYLAVFTTLVTFFILQWATTVIGPTRVMSYTFLNPALVVLIALALGGPLPPPATWAGVGLVVATTLILQWPGPPRR